MEVISDQCFAKENALFGIMCAFLSCCSNILCNWGN